jgi:hypothetical protein
MPYSANDKSIEQLLVDYEQHLLDADYGGSTTEYLHAAIMVRVAVAQRRWSRVVGIAACTSAAAAIAAVIVAIVVAALPH